ncbi:MAG: tyrosine-type recombinase/integrase, partial [Sulfitobacter sp.]
LTAMREAGRLAPIEPPVNRLAGAWQALVQGEAPDLISGAYGQFRNQEQPCALDAQTDVPAIQAWLDSLTNPQTREAYRKEMIRVVLWATTVRARAFSDLTVEDAALYRTFLKDPQPHQEWVGARRPLNHPQWRPFAQSLSPSSQRYALQVIRTCARWLREQNYLTANPWAAIKADGAVNEQPTAGQVPSRSHWGLVRRLADRLETHGWEEASANRLRFLLDFGRATGLRVSELAQLRLGHLYEQEAGEWMLRVAGKGGKTESIDLLPPAKHALETYLRQRGLSALIENNDETIPVISQLANPYAALGRKAIWRIVDRFRKLASDELATVNKRLSKQLETMSPHTLRHLCGSHTLNAGAQLTDVRDFLRHANIRTTSRYVHSDERQRRKRLTDALGN